jgi:hypothetical protein
MMPSCGFVSLACRAMVYANCLVSFMPFMALMAFIAFMCFMSCPMVGSYYTMILCQDIAVHKQYSYYRTCQEKKPSFVKKERALLCNPLTTLCTVIFD